MYISKSECNIFHKTLSQNNSSDVRNNVITELKDNDNKEHSVIEKRTSYFNILQCGRNILDQLDVTYKRAFMATPVSEGIYQPSPERERNYDEIADSLIEANVQSNRTINNVDLHKAITLLKYEKEAEHERNISNLTQVDVYKLTWKYKYATTVNDLVYTFIKSYNDDASDSRKQVQTIKEPIKDTYVHDTSVGTTNVDPVVTGVGIIGRGGPRAISGVSIKHGMIHGGTSIISSNFITHVRTDSSKMILKSDLFPSNPLKSKTLVIAPQVQ